MKHYLRWLSQGDPLASTYLAIWGTACSYAYGYAGGKGMILVAMVMAGLAHGLWHEKSR